MKFKEIFFWLALIINILAIANYFHDLFHRDYGYIFQIIGILISLIASFCCISQLKILYTQKHV